MSKVVYQEEKLGQCLKEMKPLLEKHWEEIAVNKERIKLNPDYEKYFQLEELGILHIVTARMEGVLIGYFISMITPHIHYKDHAFAMNDILFISPEHRRGRVGIRLFQKAEGFLRGLGVSVIMIGTKTHMPFDPLCKMLGYSNTERTYTKYIGD